MGLSVNTVSSVILPKIKVMIIGGGAPNHEKRFACRGGHNAGLYNITHIFTVNKE